MEMEYIVPILRINVVTEMTDVCVIEQIIAQLLQLEKDHFIAGYHQQIEKEWKKAWNNHHINIKQFQPEYFVLLYDSKFLRHPSKLCTHWLRPYVFTYVTDGGAIKLQKLDGIHCDGFVNGNQLKPYRDISSSLD